jgi:hypothetical protein
MKEVGEYFDCMKQSFRRNYWHMVEPRFQPCCGRGSFPVSNLCYRRSGLSRVGCSLLLSANSFFIPSLLAELRGCYSIWRPLHCPGAGVLWGRIVLRNCIADEAKNRAVSSSGATEPDFACWCSVNRRASHIAHTHVRWRRAECDAPCAYGAVEQQASKVPF